MIVKTDGTLWGIGKNGGGRLGDGTTTRRTTPVQIFSWEEKASHSRARYAYDGLEVIDGKLYFAGGYDGTDADTFERYDPATNQWTNLPSLSTADHGTGYTILNGKYYAISGMNLSDVEIFDPSLNSWSAGVSLPSEVNHGTAVTINGKILLVGGRNASDQIIDQVLEFDPQGNSWTVKASLLTERTKHKLAIFQNKVWAIGGANNGATHIDSVEIYDPSTNSWSVGPSLNTPRLFLLPGL